RSHIPNVVAADLSGGRGRWTAHRWVCVAPEVQGQAPVHALDCIDGFVAGDAWSAEKRVKGPERLRELRSKRLEPVGLAGGEPGPGGSGLVRERSQRRDRLIYVRPLKRPLVAVVVRRVDAFGPALNAPHLLDRATVALRDARGDDT